MKAIKTIAVVIIVMLVVAGLAYGVIVGWFQDVSDPIINPPCSVDYNKLEYNWGIVWRNKDNYDNDFVWDDETNHLILDWRPGEAIRTHAREDFLGGITLYFIEIQQKAGGGGYYTIKSQQTTSKYKTLAQHSGYMYEMLDTIKNNLNMDPDDWSWSTCMLERIYKGKA